MKRWHVTIPISGAVMFEMESEEEPTFLEAMEFHAENHLNDSMQDQIEWDYMEDLRGKGNVSAGHLHPVFDVVEEPNAR